VALRADGAAVRFHPSSKGDTVPVTMDLQDWAMGNAPKPMQGEAWYREAVPDADTAASRDSQVGRRTRKLMSMDGTTCRLLCNGCRRVVHVALMYWFPAIVAQGPPSERQL
jgi:hypothetical protein